MSFINMNYILDTQAYLKRSEEDTYEKNLVESFLENQLGMFTLFQGILRFTQNLKRWTLR